MGELPPDLDVSNSLLLVYDISILSGLPSSIIDLLPLEPLPTRLAALFSIGVRDIPTLSPSHVHSEGWVACTTDDILASKPQLYDTLITLPPSYSSQAEARKWPHVKSHAGAEIKANQRDLRRYQVLRQGTRFLTHNNDTSQRSNHIDNNASHRNSQVMSGSYPSSSDILGGLPDTESYGDIAAANDAQIVEPQSWSALGYDSFMWWASAGEKRTDMDEEEESDRALFPTTARMTASPIPPESGGMTSQTRLESGDPRTPVTAGGKTPTTAVTSADPAEPLAIETSIIAFFHRFTERLLRVLAEIIDLEDEEQDGPDGSDGSPTAYKDAVQPDNESGVRRRDNNNGDSSHVQTDGGPSKPSHRSTSASAVSDRDMDSAAADDDRPAVELSNDDLLRMGLDVWSESDRLFVRDLVALYWGLECVVRRTGIECCGVRIC